MLKIAIDSGPLKSGDSVRGIGVYTRELLKALRIEGVDVFRSDISKYDIVHFTRFSPFFVSIPSKKPKATKYVLTIYDLTPLIYPKNYPPGIKGKLNWEANKLLIKKNVDVIITISETSKKDICRFLGVNPNKVHVVYLAPRTIFRKLEVKKQYGLPERFALYVGDINYNKNIPNLVKACGLAKMPLVIVGKQAAEIESLDLEHPELTHLKNLDWSNVKRLGFMSDEDLVNIYNLASVYVAPSLYEGFGLPALEALACGTPLVVAKSQCMREVLGDEFSYCDPKDAQSMAEAIKNPNIGEKPPRDYSWEKTARETIQIYNRTLSEK